MRMMLMMHMDTAAGTKAIQDGRMPAQMQSTMEKLKPEAAYFGPHNGQRTAFIIFDMNDPAQLPPLTESLFSELHAHVEIFPVMDRADLERGLSELGTHD